MSTTPKVELNPAFTWICDHCGKRNYTRGVVKEMSPEDATKFKQETGVGDFEGGEFMMLPEEVTCTHCETKYEATVPMF